MQRPKTKRRAVDCCGCSGIYERKYELDSLANPLHLAAQYYAASQDMTPFQDDKWLSAVELTLHTMVGEGHRFCWTLQVTCVSTPTVPAAVLRRAAEVLGRGARGVRRPRLHLPAQRYPAHRHTQPRCRLAGREDRHDQERIPRLRRRLQ